MTAWQLLTGEIPFLLVPPSELRALVVQDKERPERPPNCPDVVWALLEQCWAHEIKDRPGFNFIRECLLGVQESTITSKPVSQSRERRALPSTPPVAGPSSRRIISPPLTKPMDMPIARSKPHTPDPRLFPPPPNISVRSHCRIQWLFSTPWITIRTCKM